MSQTQMKVRRRQGLPPEHSAVENNFATALESNPDEFVRRYKDRFGNVISTDSARSMWHEYEKNPGEMSFAVQYPAMALAKEVWQRELAATPKPDGSVLFLAGGAGAGKTHALNNVPEVAALAAKADLVYDSTMGNYQLAVERLQQALDSGRKAVIVYVFRPLEAAVRGIVERAVEDGRTVPAYAIARDHRDAMGNVFAIMEQFGNDPRISAIAIDNSGPAPRITSMAELGKAMEQDDLEGIIVRTVKDEYRRRKGTPGELSDKSYLAIVGKPLKSAAWLSSLCKYAKVRG